MTVPYVSETPYLRRRSTATPTEATTEGRCELARSTFFLAITLVTTTVTTITTGGATATGTTFALVTKHAARRSVRTLLLDVSGRDNLSRNVKPFTEIVKTLRGEGVIEVLPGELSPDVAAGVQGLAGLNDL